MESMKESDSVLEDFVEMYKANPCLWKVKSKQYNDKNKKRLDEKLAEKLREKDPSANKESAVKESTTNEVHLEKK
jgi:nitrogen fixation-related uncharacterized protein